LSKLIEDIDEASQKVYSLNSPVITNITNMPKPLGKNDSTSDMDQEPVSDVFKVDGTKDARTMPKAEELLPPQVMSGVHKEMAKTLKDSLPRLNL